MKITINRGALRYADLELVATWYYEQDELHNNGDLPSFLSVESIILEDEGKATVRYASGGCLSFPEQCPMTCKVPPPIDLDAPGVHVSRPA